MQYRWNSGHHYICWKSLGHWLTRSVWPCMSSGLQRPSERLAAILCLQAMSWGRRCSSLCIHNKTSNIQGSYPYSRKCLLIGLVETIYRPQDGIFETRGRSLIFVMFWSVDGEGGGLTRQLRCPWCQRGPYIMKIWFIMNGYLISISPLSVWILFKNIYTKFTSSLNCPLWFLLYVSLWMVN